MIRTAIIAGGLGTRIRSLSGDRIPKALVPVLGVPIVAYQLRLLARYGIRDIAVMGGHKGDVLREGMQPLAEDLGLNLEFFVEQELLGTAGGLSQARQFLETTSGGDFLVIYGDVAVEMDLSRLISFRREKKSMAAVVAHPNDHPLDSDLLQINADGQILNFLPKKQRAPGYHRNLVPASVYCLSTEIFAWLKSGVPQDFIKDLFPELLKNNQKIYAYLTAEYLKDMGSLQRYGKVEHDIRCGRMASMNQENLRPAVFLDRDGVLNREIPGNGIRSVDAFHLLPGAAEAIRRINQAGLLAVVVTNQPNIAKGTLSEQELDAIHAKLDTELGSEGAYLDRLYYCPHHPEKGFAGERADLKLVCTCRKPLPGMIHRGEKELSVDLAKSCIIGDSVRDIAAGRAAGLHTYGVKTGFGCKDASLNMQPDLMFDNVLDAVLFFVEKIPAVQQP